MVMPFVARVIPVLVGATVALSGCVERKIFITSEPTGALVRLNDVEVGVTPVEVKYTWYGTYDVQLERPGYDPLTTKATAKAPVHSVPGLDIAADLWPGTIKDHVHWHFELTPTEYNPDAVVERARAMRNEIFEPEPIEPGENPD